MGYLPARCASNPLAWLSLYLLAASLYAQASQQDHILGADGEVLGVISRDTQVLENGHQQRRVSRELMLQEQGTRARRLVETTTTTRGANGQVLSIERDYRVGRNHSVIRASLSAGQADITRTALGDKRRVVLDLPEDTVFDNGKQLLSHWDPTGPAELRFHVLDIGAPAIHLVRIAPDTKSSAESNLRLLRQVERIAQGSTTFFGESHLEFDRNRAFLDYTQPSFGTALKVQPRPVEQPQTKLRPRSLIAQALTKSPVRIPAKSRSSHIRFQLGYTGTTPFALPQTAEQRVRMEEGQLTVDVCGSCGPGLPTDADFLASATGATFWLQSDHPKLRRATAGIAKRNLSQTRKMQQLASLAAKRIRKLDFAGHVSALESFTRRAGDCTESAVLLAALGRSIGIPTKVASGIVYSRERYHGQSHSFMPHAWAIAYVDGAWRSFDSALEGFDSTHLAFTLSDGDPSGIAAGHRLAGLTRFNAIAQVAKGSAPRTPTN